MKLIRNFASNKITLMRTGAIITGDIVDSTKLTLEGRKEMLEVLQMIPEVLSSVQNISLDIFRGDSFQIGIWNAELSLRCALGIRAWLRSHKVSGSNRVLDARVAIGIGTLDFESDTLSTSDGEAYRFSGRLLDKMTEGRLEIKTPWQEVNEELKIPTAFADDIVSSWTQRQSNIILQSLLSSKTHLELARELGISRQMVDKSLRASKEHLINAYVGRFEELVGNKK